MKKTILFLNILLVFYFARGQTIMLIGENIIPNPQLSVGSGVLYLPPQQDSIQVNLTIQNPTVATPLSIAWSGPAGFTATIEDPWISDLGTYNVVVTNKYNCFTNTNVELRTSLWTQNPLPSLCLGDSIPLDQYFTYPGYGSYSGNSVRNNYFHADSAGVFTVVVVYQTDTSENTVTVYGKPDVVITNPNPALNCVGSNLLLTTQGIANTYSWADLSNPGTVLATTPTYTVNVTNTPKNYLLTAGMVSSDKMCYTYDTVTVSPISARFVARQDTSYASNGDVVLPSLVHFRPDYQTASSYSWNFGNNYVSGGGTSTVVNPDYNYDPFYGWFKVKLTITSFCMYTGANASLNSFEAWVHVNNLIHTGIDDDVVSIEKESIYPNPATDHVNVVVKDFEQVSFVQIFDITGKVVSQVDVTGQETIRINLNGLRPGMYLVNVVSKNNQRLLSKMLSKQ